ncbi:MAG: FAD-dependent oxidoreductase, partial [Halobacteriales archaeon]
VWAQLSDHLDGELDEDLVVDWFLDPQLRETDDGMANDAPLLINTVGSLKHRPSADPGIERLFLAADYVETNTDLASMESANEAGRRAARAVLDAEGADASRPAVWDLEEPRVFDPLKAQDRIRYRLGLPHPARARQQAENTIRALLS